MPERPLKQHEPEYQRARLRCGTTGGHGAGQRGPAPLERLLWPLVGVRADEWVREVRTHTPPPRAAVIEVPLLFESGQVDGYDATIAVIADEDLRRGRAQSRGHALGDERAARQLPQEEKARLATFVVRNDGSTGELEAQLSAVLAKLGR